MHARFRCQAFQAFGACKAELGKAGDQISASSLHLASVWLYFALKRQLLNHDYDRLDRLAQGPVLYRGRHRLAVKVLSCHFRAIVNPYYEYTV